MAGPPFSQHSSKVACRKDLLFELSVMANHAVERLEGEVPAVGDVEHAHALHIVGKEAAGTSVVDVIQEALAGMAERGVTNVVAQRDCFDEVEVEAKRGANVSCDTCNELHVKAPAREVIVRAKREDLGLSGKAVVRGHVHDLLGVAHEGRAKRALLVALGLVATQRCGVWRGKRRERPVCATVGDCPLGLGRELPREVGRELVDDFHCCLLPVVN